MERTNRNEQPSRSAMSSAVRPAAVSPATHPGAVGVFQLGHLASATCQNGRDQLIVGCPAVGDFIAFATTHERQGNPQVGNGPITAGRGP
jgi:hypothetical protein